MPTEKTMRDEDYRRLLAVRTRLREFEHWSAEQAERLGLTAHQHQLLLAIRGHADAAAPTVSDVADYLLIRHNTAVELTDRAEALGLVVRSRDGADRRVVRLRLSAEGRRILRRLSHGHVQEIAAMARMIETLSAELGTLRAT